MVNNNTQKFNADLDFGAWDSLIDKPNSVSKKTTEVNRTTRPVVKKTSTLPINNLSQNKTNNVKPVNAKTENNISTLKNNKSKKTSSNFKKISKFELNESLFLNKKNNVKQICVDILAKDDYDLIINFKKSWFFFIPLIGLILFIWITNRMFRSFKINISRTIFNNNGLNIVVIIGCLLVSMMFAVITTYLVCVFLLGLFNNLSGASSIITFIVLLLAIVLIFLLLIDYCFVSLFLFYVHPKVKKNYKNEINKSMTRINWNDVNSILKVLDGD